MLFALALDALLQELNEFNRELLEIHKDILLSSEGLKVLGLNAELEEKEGVVLVC
jgi:hypothetical protein